MATALAAAAQVVSGKGSPPFAGLLSGHQWGDGYEQSVPSEPSPSIWSGKFIDGSTELGIIVRINNSSSRKDSEECSGVIEWPDLKAVVSLCGYWRVMDAESWVIKVSESSVLYGAAEVG